MANEEVKEDLKREREAASAAWSEGQLSGSLTDRVLFTVRHRRQLDDEREGILRDYPDGTAGRKHKGPTSTTDKETLLAAERELSESVRAASPSWRNHLEVAVARVNVELNEEQLEAQLVALAALSTAWIEALRARVDRRRIDREESRRLRVVKDGKVVEVSESLALETPRVSWWRRLLLWLAGR
jgi:hypothetical protein